MPTEWRVSDSRCTWLSNSSLLFFVLVECAVHFYERFLINHAPRKLTFMHRIRFPAPLRKYIRIYEHTYMEVGISCAAEWVICICCEGQGWKIAGHKCTLAQLVTRNELSRKLLRFRQKLQSASHRMPSAIPGHHLSYTATNHSGHAPDAHRNGR